MDKSAVKLDIWKLAKRKVNIKSSYTNYKDAI